MKIAIPTKNGNVDNHFGHCEYYTIADIHNGTITSTSKYEAPQGCGCKSDVASKLRKMGVTTLLAGNMGQGAVDKISSADITVYRGCSGNVDILLNSFMSGLVIDSGKTCNSHGDSHSCNH